jgi:hypothetical protein
LQYLQARLPTFSALQFSDNIIVWKAKEADPSRPSLGIHYEFSQHMSIASYCLHIKKYHLELYLTVAEDEGWKILLLGQQAREQVNNEAATAQGEQPDIL